MRKSPKSPSRNGRATGVRLESGAGHSGFDRGLQRRCRLDLFKLLANHPRKRWTDARIGRAKYSMSLFVWYFGVNRPL
jgi:phytoene desaturase